MKNIIRDVMKNKGLLYEDLSQKVGVSIETICSIEDGKYVPSLNLALKISRELGCEVSELFYESGQVKNIRKPLMIYIIFSVIIFSISVLLFKFPILYFHLIFLLLGPVLLIVKPLYKLIEKQSSDETIQISKNSFGLFGAFLVCLAFVWYNYNLGIESMWTLLYCVSSSFCFCYLFYSKS